MKCAFCGRTMEEDARFCPYCGRQNTAAEEQADKKFCETCGIEYDKDEVYCSRCGQLLTIRRKPEPVRPAEPRKTQTAPVQPKHDTAGYPLLTMEMVSKYIGEPKIGVAKATGKLTIYEDRVEFKRIMGNAAGAALGGLGILAAAKAADKQSNKIERYEMQELQNVRTGTYMGVIPSLVLELKNGIVYTFSGVAGSATMTSAAMIIRTHMK